MAEMSLYSAIKELVELKDKNLNMAIKGVNAPSE